MDIIDYCITGRPDELEEVTVSILSTVDGKFERLIANITKMNPLCGVRLLVARVFLPGKEVLVPLKLLRTPCLDEGAELRFYASLPYMYDTYTDRDDLDSLTVGTFEVYPANSRAGPTKLPSYPDAIYLKDEDVLVKLTEYVALIHYKGKLVVVRLSSKVRASLASV